MDFGFHPTPKPKKPNRSKSKAKQKGVSYIKGVKIPHRKQRGKIKRSEYNQALRVWGEGCSICSRTDVEMHHCYFRSQGGRGNYQNLRPLCKYHHNLAHSNREFADSLREEQKLKFGEYYHCDKYDLWKLGLIENPSDELYEKFMESEEKRLRKKV